LTVWIFFVVLGALFVAVSLAIDCPPTPFKPAPPDIDPNLVHFKLLCVKTGIENRPICLTLSACDPDGDPLTYKVLHGPAGMQVANDANEASLCWMAQFGTWYVDIEVKDDPPGDPNEALTDRGTIIYQIRRENKPPVLGGCR
jgi:hypothetical protein